MHQPARDDLDTEKLIGGIRRSLRALERHAAEDDPWVLAEMVQLQVELHRVERRTVATFRDRGYTWQDIGGALGISVKTAHKRYASHL